MTDFETEFTSFLDRLNSSKDMSRPFRFYSSDNRGGFYAVRLAEAQWRLLQQAYKIDSRMTFDRMINLALAYWIMNGCPEINRRGYDHFHNLEFQPA